MKLRKCKDELHPLLCLIIGIMSQASSLVSYPNLPGAHFRRDIDIDIDTLYKVEIFLAIRLVYRYPTN